MMKKPPPTEDADVAAMRDTMVRLFENGAPPQLKEYVHDVVGGHELDVYRRATRFVYDAFNRNGDPIEAISRTTSTTPDARVLMLHRDLPPEAEEIIDKAGLPPQQFSHDTVGQSFSLVQELPEAAAARIRSWLQEHLE